MRTLLGSIAYPAATIVIAGTISVSMDVLLTTVVRYTDRILVVEFVAVGLVASLGFAMLLGVGTRLRRVLNAASTLSSHFLMSGALYGIVAAASLWAALAYSTWGARAIAAGAGVACWAALGALADFVAMRRLEKG